LLNAEQVGLNIGPSYILSADPENDILLPDKTRRPFDESFWKAVHYVRK